VDACDCFLSVNANDAGLGLVFRLECSSVLLLALLVWRQGRMAVLLGVRLSVKITLTSYRPHIYVS
jgi:hypothetical protein